MESSMLPMNQTLNHTVVQDALGRSEFGALVTHEYMLLMKLFCYEVFATIVTWTLTNIVRNFYRNYILMSNMEERNPNLDFNGNYRDGLQDEDNDEGVMYRLRKRRSKTSRTSLSVQEAPEAGYPLFSDESESEDSQAIQNSQTDESIRDAEVEENVIDFENSSLGNREEVEEKEEDTKESVFLAAPIRDLNVNLENIKKSLMLSGEEETKSLKVIEDGIKGLSIEGMSMRVKKSVEEGDGNNNAISNCSGVDVNAELGGIKIQCLKKLDFFQDEMKSNDEIKEQLSSPI